MPKKTRMQKIGAAKRRKPIVMPTYSSTNKSVHNIEQLKKPTLQKGLSKENLELSNTTRIPTQYLINDLYKTLTITFILIMIQIGLFISSKNNFFDISSITNYLN